MIYFKKTIAIVLAAAMFPAFIVPEHSAASGTDNTVQSVYADDHANILSGAVYTINPKLSGKYVTAGSADCQGSCQ